MLFVYVIYILNFFIVLEFSNRLILVFVEWWNLGWAHQKCLQMDLTVLKAGPDYYGAANDLYRSVCHCACVITCFLPSSPYATACPLMAIVETPLFDVELITTVRKGSKENETVHCRVQCTLCFVAMKWNQNSMVKYFISYVCRMCHAAIPRYAVLSMLFPCFSSYCWTHKKGVFLYMSPLYLPTVTWHILWGYSSLLF